MWWCTKIDKYEVCLHAQLPLRMLRVFLWARASWKVAAGSRNFRNPSTSSVFYSASLWMERDIHTWKVVFSKSWSVKIVDRFVDERARYEFSWSAPSLSDVGKLDSLVGEPAEMANKRSYLINFLFFKGLSGYRQPVSCSLSASTGRFF